MSSSKLQTLSFGSTTLGRIHEQLTTLQRRTLNVSLKRAAVLIPLCYVDSDPAVVFTQRAESVSTHKGQVSFPGGMVDESDVSLEATALREWEEEMGVCAENVTVLGMFHDVKAITGVVVTPVIGYLGRIEDLPPWAPNHHEINEVFTLTLSQLTDPANRDVQVFPHRGAIPVFHGGPAPVWGLTAAILDEFLKTMVTG